MRIKRLSARGIGGLLLMSVLSAAVPDVSGAQTLDHGVGEQPSRELSVPPNAPRINRLGAMRRAYSPEARKKASRQVLVNSQTSKTPQLQ